MGTTLRPEISVNNKYYISKHRYYELKHFCLQYHEWKEDYNRINAIKGINTKKEVVDYTYISDNTCDLAIIASDLSSRIDLVERTAYEADPDLMKYILKAVTENVSFSYLQSVMNIPCGKDMYYDRYRKFFWLLSKER